MSNAWVIKERLYDAFNDHDLGRVSECYSKDAVLIGPEGVAEGPEQIVSFYEHLIMPFPDVRITPWYKVSCDDPAVTEWMLTGTHMGPFLLPSGRYVEGTGNHVAIRGCCVAHIANDKVVTHQHYYDQLELCSQIGLSSAWEPAT